MRFQPIVSCRGTYQDAVSVPCLGAPFIRCIWTVGIKKCAVTVPTLRPLGLLEMRKSRLCVCPSLGTSRVPHAAPALALLSPLGTGAEVLLELLTLQGLLPRQHPAPLPAPDVCRGSSSAGSDIPWPSSELRSNFMALLCQLFLFPCEKLLFFG